MQCFTWDGGGGRTALPALLLARTGFELSSRGQRFCTPRRRHAPVVLCVKQWHGRAECLDHREKLLTAAALACLAAGETLPCYRLAHGGIRKLLWFVCHGARGVVDYYVWYLIGTFQVPS